MKRKRLWLIIAVVVVLLVAAMAIWRMYAPPYGYRPTGDELFDRYALLVLKDLEEGSFLNNVLQKLAKRNSTNPQKRVEEALAEMTREQKETFAVLASWEDEFKGDSRYWQLRAISSQESFVDLGSLIPGYQNEPIDPDTQQQLLELIERGDADEGCFGAVNYYGLNQSDPELAIKLAKQAVAFYPDNAFHHYMLAALLAEQGESEQAVKELRIGNAAPRSELPPVYPFSVIAEHPEYLEQETVQAIRAYMDNVRLNWFTANVSLLGKNLVRIIVRDYDLKAHPEIADELITCSLRFAERDSPALIRLLVCFVMLGIVINDMQANGFALSPAQQREFDQILKEKDHVYQEIKQYGPNRPAPQPSIAGFQLPSDLLPSREAYIQLWQEELQDRIFVNQCLTKLSILDPPPFARWARGELIFTDEQLAAGIQ